MSKNFETIGNYGKMWMRFMEEQHPELVQEMQPGQLEAVARSVDRAAWEYRELLDAQYEQMNPRSTDFEAALQWERARAFYTDSAVMRERVLVAVTT